MLFAYLIEHVEHDAGIEQISHRLQVCKLSNHFMKLNFLFRSQRSPSMLNLVFVGILQPWKPAGSARVLICSCCHHNFFCFISSVQRYDVFLKVASFWGKTWSYCSLSHLRARAVGANARERGSGGRGDFSFDGSEELVLQLLLDVGARLIVREDVAPDGQKLGGS